MAAILTVFLSYSSAMDKKEIHLKWNKSYVSDNLDKNITALKWCLSFLGSNIASDTLSSGIRIKKPNTIILNIHQLGFNKNATRYLKKLNTKIKKTEEYQKTHTVDLGRYIALTIGSSRHYYNIVNTPKKLREYYSLYTFDSISGYIDNSSISLVDRIISISKSSSKNKQAYIAAEVDSITKEIYEYETVEVMPNGQIKFGIYDKNGLLKDAANTSITNAGKPAKCIWCHETGIQPTFRTQKDHDGYLSYQELSDTLDYYNKQLRSYQDSLWLDKKIKNKRLHTEMEVTYIAFMEPSAEHLANEWGISLQEVQNRLKHLKTHRHHEFDFLGDLYHRSNVDSISPWKVLKVPLHIREKSTNEVNYLK